MKESLSLRQQIKGYHAFLCDQPNLPRRQYVKLMVEILRLDHLLRLSEENVPISVNYMERESVFSIGIKRKKNEENYNLHRRESDGRTDCAMHNEVWAGTATVAG